ncbi:MAG: PAS domain-containing protein [Burkholderiaceae bacterium]
MGESDSTEFALPPSAISVQQRTPASFALPRRRRSWPVVLGFVGIVVIQVAVAVISIDVLSAVRAFVSGESLYSKGQKDAQIYLLAYAENNLEADYRRFREALAVPLADRAAREAMQAVPPDVAGARAGLLGSQTPPDDIPGVIRLFLWFQHTPLMAPSIRTWTEGDEVIEQMRRLVEAAHERIAAGDVGAVAVSEMRRQAPLLNARMTTLERQFADELGVGSRQAQQLLLWINLLLAATLAATGLGFIRYSLRRQAAVEDEVRHRQQSLQGLLDSTAEGLYGVDMAGRCTFINRAALHMLGYEREADVLGQAIHRMIRQPGADEPVAPVGSERHVTDEAFQRRDGSSFSVE